MERKLVSNRMIAAAWIAFGWAVAAGASAGRLFDRLNLDYPGMERVKAAVEEGDLDQATAHLAVYYRSRTGTFHFIDAHNPAAGVADPDARRAAAGDLVQRTGAWDAALWSGDGFDWERASMRHKERMYAFSTFGQAASVEEGDDIAQALVRLIRSFAVIYPDAPSERQGGMWSTLATGIRMRSGWPDAFLYLLNSSAAFTDDDIVLFLDSVWMQTNHLRHFASETSNWLTFEMAGLYTSGAVFPEFADATEWRRQACLTVNEDIARGWLPDGMSIEKSASYGTFISNYFHIYRLARHIGRLDEFNGEGIHLGGFPARTEPLFEAYLKLMSPDRRTPVLNDGGTADVVSILRSGLEFFPQRQDFHWIVTDGIEGTPPEFTTSVFPYAGYMVMRSGWERDANYLFFDGGPVGYRHAHQDKLNVLLWAYGRQMLFDSSQSAPETRFERYFKDTFSHNTGLVDNRPQRRRWYNNPHPRRMPYEPVREFEYKVEQDGSWARSLYDEHYGLPGSMGNNSYPYSAGSNFREGWGRPASQYRQIAQGDADLFVVQDWFVPNDEESHRYEIRWQVDSTRLQLDGVRAVTTDPDVANLAVIPLVTDGLHAGSAVAQTKPEIMGWKSEGGQVQPLTTLFHIREGIGSKSFLTLLLPLRPGATADAISIEIKDDGFQLETGDGRVFRVRPARDPGQRLTVDPHPGT